MLSLALTRQRYLVADDHSVSGAIHRTLAYLHVYGREMRARIPWLLQTSALNSDVSSQDSQSSESALSATAAMKLLVVEDECIVALDLISTLRQMGYSVVGHAISGEEALEETARSQPNLVLMDIRLKGHMDGIDAAERIRDRLGIPVIFLTASSDNHTLQRAQATGMAGFLHKPFSRHQLEEVILRVLQNSAST